MDSHSNKHFCKLAPTPLRGKIRAAANKGFAIGGVSCSADSLLVNRSFFNHLFKSLYSIISLLKKLYKTGSVTVYL